MPSIKSIGRQKDSFSLGKEHLTEMRMIDPLPITNKGVAKLQVQCSMTGDLPTAPTLAPEQMTTNIKLVRVCT
jgi:hypothetical protein